MCLDIEKSQTTTTTASWNLRCDDDVIAETYSLTTTGFAEALKPVAQAQATTLPRPAPRNWVSSLTPHWTLSRTLTNQKLVLSKTVTTNLSSTEAFCETGHFSVTFILYVFLLGGRFHM